MKTFVEKWVDNFRAGFMSILMLRQRHVSMYICSKFQLFHFLHIFVFIDVGAIRHTCQYCCNLAYLSITYHGQSTIHLILDSINYRWSSLVRWRNTEYPFNKGTCNFVLSTPFKHAFGTKKMSPLSTLNRFVSWYIFFLFLCVY